MKKVKLKFTYEIVMLLDDSEYEETKKTCRYRRRRERN